MQQDLWASHPTYGRHVVSRQGDVAHVRNHHLLKTSVNQSGVRYVSLHNTITGKYENKSVGALVCETFHGTPTERESTVLHRDGDLDNNAADNLMWATRWHAMGYHQEIRLDQYRKTRYVIDTVDGVIYESAYHAAMVTGCLPSQIDYGRRYNDDLATETHLNFWHKTYPGNHIFRTP